MVIAHELAKQVDNTTKIRIWALADKLPNKVPVGFDEVWYADMAIGGGKERHAQIQTLASNVLATTRGQLPDGWDMRKGLQATLKQIGYE